MAYRPQKQHLLRNQWIFVGDVAVLGCLLDVVLKDQTEMITFLNDRKSWDRLGGNMNQELINFNETI